MENYDILNDFLTLADMSRDFVERIGDCPNVEISANSNSMLWNTLERKNGWCLQKGKITGNIRIVSPDGKQMGNGSESAMREKMQRLSSREFLRPGDVIGVNRAGLYEHYGIYAGNDKVVHYAGEGDDFGGRISIHESPLSDFLKNSTNYFVVYIDGTRPIKIQASTCFVFNSHIDCYSKDFQDQGWNSFSCEETLKRAYSRLGECRYSLVTNNCEHFAIWCKTGVSASSQVKQVAQYVRKMEIDPRLLGCTAQEFGKLLTN